MKKELLPQDVGRKAMNAALLLLKFRGRGEAELSRRLAMKDYPPEVVAKTIARLKELGLLDDARLAREWVERRRAAGQGEARIREALRQRGIPRDLIDRILKERLAPSPCPLPLAGESETEADRAWVVLTRRAERLERTTLDRGALYRRLGGYLGRQGFSAEVTHDALEKFFRRLNMNIREEGF